VNDESRFHLANRLRVARAEHRLSQEELARRAGVTRQTIGAIENGQYYPSALLAFVLARHLNMPVTDLFYLEDPTDDVSKNRT
jgi:putative transcriptional regulator